VADITSGFAHLPDHLLLAQGSLNLAALALSNANALSSCQHSATLSLIFLIFLIFLIYNWWHFIFSILSQIDLRFTALSNHWLMAFYLFYFNTASLIDSLLFFLFTYLIKVLTFGDRGDFYGLTRYLGKSIKPVLKQKLSLKLSLIFKSQPYCSFR